VNGNVGIGTNTPDTKLVVSEGTGNAVASNMIASFEDDANAGIAVSVPDGNVAGLYFPHSTGIYYAGIERRIADLALVNNGAIRLTIDSSGNVDINSVANCGSGGLGTDSAGILTCNSDERLKTIHGPYQKGIDALSTIQPIHFSFREDSGLNGTFYGFSAQNVNATIPEAVHVGNAGKLNLDTGTILATTVNAINEQQQEIISLKLEIETLKELICIDHPDSELCDDES